MKMAGERASKSVFAGTFRRSGAPTLATALAVFALAGVAMAEDEAPIDCNNPANQAEMTNCARLDFDAADAELNKVWKKVRAVKAETDRKLAKTSPEMVGAVDALLRAQRSWIDYRDAHCEAYGFEARGGTMEPMLVAACKANLTKARTKELLSLLENY